MYYEFVLFAEQAESEKKLLKGKILCVSNEANPIVKPRVM